MEEQLRVFVIDDDPLVLRAIERVLRSNGFAVEVFTSPTTFLDRPPYDGVACMLLDLLMPGLNGLDVQEMLIGKGSLSPDHLRQRPGRRAVDRAGHEGRRGGLPGQADR